MKHKIIGNKAVIIGRPADLLQPEFEELKNELGDLAQSDEDVLVYAMFPQIGKEFLENKYKQEVKQENEVIRINATMREEHLIDISLLKGVEITLVSITVVFVVLVGLMLIIESFKYIFKEDSAQQNAQIVKKETKECISIEDDQESKRVAAITALIIANEEQQDRHYQITSIKRIK